MTSKIGALIAIGVVTTFVLGLFAWQHSMAVDREGQAVADSVSELLDVIGNTNAATVVNVSFGNEAGQIPGKINGDVYTINLTESSVIVRSGGRMWMSKLVIPVVPENLTIRAYNITEYDSLTFDRFTGEHISAGNFYMERAVIDVSGETRYITLVYWE